MDRDQDQFTGLPTKDREAPAIGYSLACNLGGDRQMTVQCFVGQDEDDDTINAKIDRIFRVADRQKAKYDLEKLEGQFEETGRHLRNFLNAIPMADEKAKHEIALLKVELNAMIEARDDIEKAAYNTHANTRKGPYKQDNLTKSKLAAADAEITKKRESIDAKPKDAAQNRDQVIQSVYKYQADLAKQRQKINDLRSMAGLEAYTVFMDEETADPLKG